MKHLFFTSPVSSYTSHKPNFRNFLHTEKVFYECLSLLKLSKTLRTLKKPCLLNKMPFLHSYTRKSIISRKDVRIASEKVNLK